ncbi:outer membrane protein assembly factor BamA [Chlorobium phaeovibrioides]|uniref:Outer membrane protein assembly factor BamA n=1 Tax=Chlorobium phaeovibrioides TaxID=1094 RepID=A0A3S0L698_CHLPH|nr:outer membrane protein assembly factor BamA [Chlorobium phaeovibrioides]KAA6230643.1 outer membrane protein assembly factor BamA [Chlorobium phaeovibrioides]QEQ56481.1 outer membrane protein assembly factor BamA [Chlorobium phaeovibrioides]RTY39069.1 outer membrane protein assembly factor BamA [Chlorobium phaeovibrioides]
MKRTEKHIIPFLLAAVIAIGGTVPAPRATASAAPVAQSPEAGTTTVVSISIKGLQTLDQGELKASLPIKEGDTVRIPGPELSGTMQYLWNLGHFSDISLDTARPGANRTSLTFTVVELPILDNITFKGNKKVKVAELEKTAALITGKTLTQQELVTAANKIEKLYATKGYLTAGAEFKLQKTSRTNHYQAIFTISEGPKVSIDKITFHGNTAFDQGKLRGVLKETSQNSWWRSIFGSPKLDRDKLAEDKNLLVEFYRNNGYRDARVLRDEVSYTKNKKGLYLDIYLSEGPKYSIRTVTWIGNTKDFATTETLNTTFAIQKGDLYNAKKIEERLNYSQDNTDVSSLYLDRGYLSFRAKLEERVVKPDSVDLTVYLTEGEQYQLNSINIKGNTKTKDHVIRRELHTVPGDMFSRKNVVRSIRELNMLNYFNPETLTPDVNPNEKDNTVDLTYNVEEKQTDTFNASVGYSGIGFTGALGVTFNNFSLKDIFKSEAYKPIPHGDGQKLSFQWQFGDDDYSTLAVSVTEPWAFGTPTSVGFSAFTSHRSYDYTDDGNDNPDTIDQYGATLSVGKRLTWPDDYFSINWKLKFLHSEGGFLSFVDDTNAPEQADEISITQTISRNSIDNPIYPRRGSNNSISAQLAGGVLPGTVDFYKFTGSSSWFIPVTKKFVWNLSTQHGYMSTFNDDDYVPYTEYFYMGGSGMSSLQTVPLRGYDDRSLGTQIGSDETSELYGGTVYSKFTTELRYPLTLSSSASVYALTFLEAGGLWENSSDVNFSDLKKSAGVGMRLYLPIIGQVGIDYGYGFDAIAKEPEKSKQGWVFLFSFGTSFY